MGNLHRDVESMLRYEQRVAVSPSRRRAIAKDFDKTEIYGRVRDVLQALLDAVVALEKIETRVRRLESLQGLGRS